jgi:integrase
LNPRLSRSRIDRDEILALRWADIDVDAATVRIERSLEQTKAGLRFKAPKPSTDAA